ncbi:MAG: response regulator, partial [Armatimonadota bacterium]
GSEFVRELRRDPDLADLPVIVLHAFPENGLSRPLTGDELKKGHRLGKPFNPQELLMIIRYTRSKGQNPKRVLIVENDEDVIALLRCCLGTEGYYITVVADGTEALERMQGDRPALLIIGDQPPGITGAEFVTLLRSDPALCMVPAIVLHCKYWTAEGKTWGNALQEGVHIQKPANPWEVRAYARRVLSSPN